MKWSLPWRRRPQRLVPPEGLDRPLSDDEDATLRWILWLEDFPGADELRAQVDHVRATWGRTTEIKVEVVGGAAAPVADGLLPVGAVVVGEDEKPTGFIGVWVKGGFLRRLEYSWVTDEMPTEYPSPDRLRFFDA
jgi:hypothetical protein